ncbi:MAG: hypothetical protein K7J47_23910, partial [Acidobacteria bacterium]|nr:hypothetical protein [Bryobacteraceae bacterium CoA2 C42]
MANGKLYTLKRGDTILHLAHENGFRAWEPIWLHPNNAALRQQRPNPHVLATGDQLFIPDKEPLDHSCHTNRKHTFRVPSLTQYLQQTLLDANHEPLAGLPYLLTAGGRQFRGKTDNNGYFKQEIPIHVKTAELKLWLVPGNETSAREWTLEIGHLEPI